MDSENLENLCMFFLSKLPAETSHDLARYFMKMELFTPGRYSIPESKTKLFDVELDNPFGIAAGFDKYAELQDVVKSYGFGFIESGSYTFFGSKGNKKPRLFRDAESGGLINRMGLNGIPAHVAQERLSKAKDPNSFAVNIAKTHDEEIIGEMAIKDVVYSYKLLKNLGIYTAINISCPNTAEGKIFEDLGSFRELVEEIRAEKAERKSRPLVFKFSPDLEKETLEKLIEISYDIADGYEVTNTLPINHHIYGKGGLSGPKLRSYSREMVSFLRGNTNKTILGCGGISTEKEAYELEEMGAEVFLVFNGFVHRHKENSYAGSKFSHKINEGLINLRRIK
ncbi:MAG: dihydroorotate dehydrogenase 2 [Nanoarchaeota archaeon]|nr:dihydroorotate dehydrogenase 2 [Nanoarchaeota archaeon]